LGLLERAEVDVREGTFKELNVKLVAEEDRDIVDWVLDSEVAENLVSEVQNGLND
jgi:hypothetical protein